MPKPKALHHLRVRHYVTKSGESRTLFYVEIERCWDGKTRSWPAGDNKQNAITLRDIRLGQNSQRYNFEQEKTQQRGRES